MVETIALPQLFDSDIGFGNEFSDTVAKNRHKAKRASCFTNKKRQTFCCQTSAFCTHCNTLLHTVFISECFQLVVPAMIFVETFALPQPIGNEIASVTNFRIRWQKTDTKPKGLPAFTNKTRQTFCCQTPAFCTHCNTLLHTVFISECFQLVVPAMIFVEMFALPQLPDGNICFGNEFSDTVAKIRQKAKRASCFTNKKRQTFCCQTSALCTHCNVDLHVSLYACRECCPRRQPTQ